MIILGLAAIFSGRRFLGPRFPTHSGIRWPCSCSSRTVPCGLTAVPRSDGARACLPVTGLSVIINSGYGDWRLGEVDRRLLNEKVSECQEALCPHMSIYCSLWDFTRIFPVGTSGYMPAAKPCAPWYHLESLCMWGLGGQSGGQRLACPRGHSGGTCTPTSQREGLGRRAGSQECSSAPTQRAGTGSEPLAGTSMWSTFKNKLK